ncbi:MAG: hypothetical protein AAF647_12575 [Pseudomonadota bacterium]
MREGEFGLEINAGHLMGVDEGDLLALLPSAASSLDDALGYAEVTFSDTFLAEIEPVAVEGFEAVDPFGLPEGVFARALEDDVDFTLRVAAPEGDIPDELAAALAFLAEDAAQRLEFVPAGDPADVRLAVIPDSPRPGAVYLLPGSGFFEADKADQTPSVGFEGRDAFEIAGAMEASLETISRAVNLLRMGGQYDQTDLDVRLTLQTRNRRERELRDLDTASVPKLIPRDEVHVLAVNNEDFPIDANVLYIGSDYSISHFWRGRLNPGDELKKGLFRITDEAFGRDRVIIILSPAEAGSDEPLDLRFLAQDAVVVTRGTGISGGGFAGALREAGFGTTTRGATAIDDGSGPSPAILQFDLDTVPES